MSTAKPDDLSRALAALLTLHGRWAAGMVLVLHSGLRSRFDEDDAARFNGNPCTLDTDGCDYTDPATWGQLLAWLIAIRGGLWDRAIGDVEEHMVASRWEPGEAIARALIGAHS